MLAHHPRVQTQNSDEENHAIQKLGKTVDIIRDFSKSFHSIFQDIVWAHHSRVQTQNSDEENKSFHLRQSACNNVIFTILAEKQKPAPSPMVCILLLSSLLQEEESRAINITTNGSN